MLFFIFFISSFPLLPSWKNECAVFFKGSIIDYEASVNYLSQIISTVPQEEKHQVTFLIAYCMSNLNNPDAELQFLKAYFETWHDRAPNIDFLPDNVNLKISEYYNSSLKKYPLVTDIKLTINKFFFNEPPSSIGISLLSHNLSSYSFSFESNTVSSGLLKKGQNVLEFTLPQISKDQKYSIEFIFSFSNITIKKSYYLAVSISKPTDIIIDNNTVKYTNRAFKEETITQKRIQKKSFFDNKYFLKNSLPYFLVGAGSLTVNQFYIRKTLKDMPFSKSGDQFLYAANRTLNYLSISISAFAFIHLIKSFKTQKIEQKETSIDQAAVNYNKFLRDTLEETKKKILISIALLEKSQ